MSRTFYSRYTKGDNISISITSSDFHYIDKIKDLVESSDKEIININIVDEGRNKTLEILMMTSMEQKSGELLNEIMSIQ